MSEEKKKYIELDTIDTSVAAKNFANMLDKNRLTFFLNGVWGAGKTEFLRSVAEKSKKKFVYLDLWCVKDDRSVLRLAYLKLVPVLYIGSMISGVGAVVAAILSTNAVNIGLESIMPSWLIHFTMIIALFVSVYSYFKIKSDSIFNILINCLPKCILNKRVLVIDDFDRIEEKRQEEAYKLFNILSHRMTVVFVGDFQQIYRSNDRYLEKIIDRRIELPFILQPINIWKDYLARVSEKLSCELLDELEKISVYEKRNLREREHFNNYVNREFFDKGKKGHVQVEQELLLIYVYLFHPEYYQKLLDDWKFKSQLETQDSEINRLAKNQLSGEGLLKHKLFQLQNKNNLKYPRGYSTDKTGYLLFEEVNNTTIEEFEKIINTEDELKNMMLCNIKTDFYYFLSSEYKNFDDITRKKIMIPTIEYIKERKNSDSIYYVLREQDEIFRQELNGEGTIKKWIDELKQYNVQDLSEVMYLLSRYTKYNFYELDAYFGRSLDYIFKDRSKKNKFLDNFRNLDALLMVYLSRETIYEEPETWVNPVVRIVDELNTEQFLTFWTYCGVLDSVKMDPYYTKKSYKVSKKIVHKNWLDKNTLLSRKEMIEKIQPKLDELTKEGYQFIYEDEKSRI